MNYLIGRDIDNDGYLEFIQNMNTMALTEDPSRALQFTAADLNYIDMAYMNSLGFYAVEAPRFGVSLLEHLLFRPTVRSYRPPVAPPPRRRGPGMYPHPRPMPRGPVGGPRGPIGGPRGPIGGPVPRGPVNMGPGSYGPGYNPDPYNPNPYGPGPHGPGRRGPGGRGMGGPGGFGPGR